MLSGGGLVLLEGCFPGVRQGSPRGARKEFLEKKIHRVLLFFRGIFPAGFASSSQGDGSRERALRS